jgi:hypothetical protein
VISDSQNIDIKVLLYILTGHFKIKSHEADGHDATAPSEAPSVRPDRKPRNLSVGSKGIAPAANRRKPVVISFTE